MAVETGTSQGTSLAFETAQARRAGLRRAMDGTEAALAAPAIGRIDEWTAGLGVALQTLQGALQEHTHTTEQPDGILDEIVRLSPRLANPVAGLRRDHVELHQLLVDEETALGSAPAAPGQQADWIAARRDEVMSLLGRLARHRQHGADLTYEAYGVDIGGET
jgi:hypothetical protein